MNRTLSLQFYLVSTSSAGPGPCPCNCKALITAMATLVYTFSKRMFEQFTEYLTGWKICQLPLSFEGSKLFSFREGASPPDRADPLSAPVPRWGLHPQTPATTPHCKPPGLATVLGHCITYVVGLWFHYPVHALQSRQMSAQTAATAMHNRIGLSRHYHICSVDDRICYNELQY